MIARHETQRPIRLWTAPPQPDETAISYLSRASQHCGLTRNRLARMLCPTVSARCLSDPDTQIDHGLRLAILAAAGFDTVQPYLLSGVTWGATLLPVKARRSYCPLCALADLDERRPPYLRWQWSVRLTTVCHLHGVPLFAWRPSVQAAELRWPVEWLRENLESSYGSTDWLEEDAIAARDAKDRHAQHFGLLARLQAPTLRELDDLGNGRAPERNPLPCHLLRGLTEVIASIGGASSGKSVAETLLPDGMRESGIFGVPPEHGCSAGKPSSPERVLESHDLAWRRTVLWLTAEVIFDGSGGHHIWSRVVDAARSKSEIDLMRLERWIAILRQRVSESPLRATA